LTASGGVSYEWDNNLGTNAIQTVSPTETTTYTVIGEDSNGCENFVIITIIVTPLPIIFPGIYDPVCIDANPIALSGNPNNGTFTGHPAISGNFFNPSFSGVGTFAITYTASENGCENSETTTIIVNDLPTVDAGNWGPYCIYDNDVALTGNPASGDFSGGPFISNNVFSPEDAGPGTHTVTYTYTDANGCTNTATTDIVVNDKPIVEAGIYPDVCLDSGDFELVGNPIEGDFSGIGVSADGTMFEPLTAGVGTHVITYIYEDPITGCSDQATADIAVVATPEAPIVSSNSPVCEGETISITVVDVPGGQFMWTGPDGLISTEQNLNLTNVTENQEGTYRVKVTVNGCDSEWSEIEVIVNPIPETPVLTSNGPVCAGETIILMTDGVTNATYAWSGPDGMTSTEQNPEVENVTEDNEGQYCLIVTVAGCESEFACIDVIVNPIPLVPIITTSAPVCIDSDITFGTDVVADAYQWYDQDGGEFSMGQFPVLVNSTLVHNGEWSLVVTIDGCASDTGFVNVVVNDLPIVDAGTYADMCADDDAIILLGSPINGTFSINTVELTSFNPADFGAGLDTIDYVFQDVNGCENFASTTINVNATPTLELVSVDCSADLNSYVVTFNSDAVVTAGGETVSGNQVIDIAITDDVILTATSVDGCTIELPVSRPQCDCEDVAAVASAGDVEICFGETTPVVSATADADLVIDWFSAPTGSSLLLIAGTNDYQSPETDVGVYIYYAEARNPIDDCTSSTRTEVTLTIKALPVITNIDLTAEICSGDMTPGFALTADQAGTTFSWSVVAIDVDGSFSNGVGNIPAEALTTIGNQGTVTYTVIPILNGCQGDPIDFVVTINGLPTITIDNKECSDDLSTYAIEYTSDFDVTSSHGLQITNGFEGITSGTIVTLTVTNTATGCTDEVIVTAPQCDCDNIAAPINPMNQEICIEDDAVVLTVEVGNDISVNWYSNPVGGISLGTSTSFTPLDVLEGVYTYYAEATDDITDCIGETRTEVTYTIHAMPSIIIDSKECTSDLSMYVIIFSGTEITVSTLNGTISGNEITVATNENTTLSITDNVTGCISILEVTAPDCDCSIVPEPVSVGDEVICENDTTPTLTVTVAAGMQANWYLGNVLLSGGENTTSYTPIVITPGVYIFEVEAVNPVDDCISATRTLVRLTINEPPTVAISDKDCSTDLETYSITVTTDGTFTTSHGTIAPSGTMITGIPSGQTLTLTITKDGCTIIETVAALVCACDPIVAPVVADESICVGGFIPTFSVAVGADETVDWFESDCSTLMTNGVSGLSFTPPDTDAGIYTYCAQIKNSLDDCTSDATTFTFIINELPSISLVSTPCSADFSTYNVVVTGSGIITATDGTPNGNTIEGILADTDITVTILDANGCVNTLDVQAPICACDPIDPPISDGDASICFGDANLELTASVGANEIVEWYESDCTTLLETGPSYTPIPTVAGVYTYCLITRNTVDNCTSDMSTTVTFTIHELPTITFGTPECSADLLTYSVTFTTTDIVASDIGSVTGNMVIDIPAGLIPQITVTNTTTSCTITDNVVAPICECDDVDAPIIVNNDSVCLSETNTELTVSASAGSIVTWYDLAIGGTELTTGFTYASLELVAGTYTYYVEAGNPITGCISDRTPVTFTIFDLPILTVDAKECAADKLTYDVTISGDVTLTIVTNGTISGNMIIGIPADTTITVTFTDNITGCENSQEIVAPNCDCDLVDTPISGGDQVICFGEVNPLLSVQSVTGITFNWYSESTGGILLDSDNTYMPLEGQVGVYSYYVEAEAVDGCISNTRTEVSLTINELPTLVEDTKECDPSLLTYSVTIIVSGDITNHSIGDLIGNEISNIPAGTTVEITVTDPITGCKREFEITAPVCVCEDVPEPTVTNDEVCFGSNNPFLIASTISGHTIDWYDMEVGGTALAIDEDMYQPAQTSPGMITIWVVAINEINGCESDRVPVTLTINELPTMVIDGTDCSPDLSMYNVNFTTTANITMTSAGTISGNQVINIPADMDIDVTIQDPMTGCVNTINVVAADCDCIDVDVPSVGNQEICFGEPNTALTATTTVGNELNWYIDNTITTAFQTVTNSYLETETTPGVYSVFVSATDLLTGCESDRIEVSLTIKEVSTITNIDREEVICSGEMSTGFIIESDQSNTTYTWTANGQDVTGFDNNGIGNITASLLTNNTQQEGNVTYSVTPTLNGCVGDAVDFIVAVNPTPNAGSAQSAECFIDAEFIMNATGNGEWTSTNADAQFVNIENTNDPNSRIFGFIKAGSYEFSWTVNGCSEIVTLTINDNCPCIIESNNLIDNVDDTYCITTGNLILIGDEAQPNGGAYTWEVNIDGVGYISATGINNTKDYDASNLGNGSYQFRRIYELQTAQGQCSEVSNNIEFLVFSDKATPGEVLFDPNPVCAGDTLFLMVDDYNPNLTYNWTVGSGNARVIYQLDSMSSIVVESSGTITVSVTQSLDDCVEGNSSIVSTLDIEVLPIPRFTLGIDTTFCELDETYFLNPGEFEEYLWQDGSDDQEFEVEGEGIYSVTVSDTTGCVAKDEIDVKSFCCDFVWPNIIKADGIGQNSLFEVTDIYGCAITSKLYIYDRWGNLVFLGENTTEWDGFFNGEPVEQGVYVFIYEYMAKDADREVFEDKLTGDITVIRER
jgi:gliding motility-associated-like protein